MASDTLLDALPLGSVLLGTILLELLVVETGFRVGRSWQHYTHSEKEGSVGAMTAATLGLLAFLLAFITGIAVNRFDARCALVVREANAIGTAFLRAGFLDPPLRNEARILLAEYVDTRLAPVQDFSLLRPAVARSEEIQRELWLRVESPACRDAESPGVGLYIEALNDLINVHVSRVKAVSSSRIPVDLWLSIYSVAILTMLLVGLQTSYSERRNWVSLLVLVTVFSLVLTLIVDLDRPTEGLLTISQQALADVQTQIRAFGP